MTGHSGQEPIARSQMRVLIVDDNRDTADSMALLVRLWGYDARATYSGLEALAVYPAFTPRVVFLDLGMPHLDGFRLARLLKPAPSPVPILVAVTGHGDEAHRRRCLATGFEAFLVKPVDPVEIQTILHCAARL